MLETYLHLLRIESNVKAKVVQPNRSNLKSRSRNRCSTAKSIESSSPPSSPDLQPLLLKTSPLMKKLHGKRDEPVGRRTKERATGKWEGIAGKTLLCAVCLLLEISVVNESKSRALAIAHPLIRVHALKFAVFPGDAAVQDFTRFHIPAAGAYDEAGAVEGAREKADGGEIVDSPAASAAQTEEEGQVNRRDKYLRFEESEVMTVNADGDDENDQDMDNTSRDFAGIAVGHDIEGQRFPGRSNDNEGTRDQHEKMALNEISLGAMAVAVLLKALRRLCIPEEALQVSPSLRVFSICSQRI